ncbi:MAG: hypothetical protein IK095_05480 [Oscillospiraceae bacterium]|nr:hypothetical protein [Oscillospiraceae bacterium]
MPKKDLKQALRMLDIDRGGIFPELKRSIIKGNSFLIVSYGGTGGDALEVIKQNLQRYLDPQEMDRYVRILAIDTDTTAQYRDVPDTESGAQGKTRKEERFTGKEFFWLDNKPGRQAVDLYASDGAMQSWINPRIVEKIEADKTTLAGDGASATRQFGRVLLYPQTTVVNLQTRITTLAGQITAGNANRLRVMIVSGISGGTGSGIVVDASYLIRDAIDRMPGGMKGRTDYMGFLLLPPTGKSEDPNEISRGDRNGAAALKEIDHFMTIANRKEQYVANFQSQQIVSNDNIFTTCYLIDGVFSGVALEDPRGKANEVVSDSILDMMTSQPAASKAGRTQATVDSFICDANAAATHIVANLPQQKAPRSANYIYCALGHGKTLIPLDLMKAYVAKMVFDRIYGMYLKCSDVQPSDIEAFVKEVRVPLGSFVPTAPNAQRERVRAAADIPFADLRRGPYYTINLLDGVREWCNVEIDRVNGNPFKTRAAKEKECAQLSCIRDTAYNLNKKIFNTYTLVIDEMAAYLKQQHGIITDHKKMETYNGSTYTFSPIDLGSTEPKSMAVQKYLVDLVSPKRVGEMATALVKEMIQHRAEWVQLEAPEGQTPRFDAGERIRQFWEAQVGKIVSSTIEDYLVKYYSGDPDARVVMEQTDNGLRPDAESAKYLKIAAQEIVSQMLGAAGGARPLAEMQLQILPEQNFKSNNIFLVPASAPNLSEFIEEEIQQQNGLKVDVLESFADDRLSCYTQFTGLPAYMFTWVSRAEPSYEQALRNASEGLHMSETKGGDRWQDYPNLLPRGIWGRLGGTGYTNNRENAIVERCRDLFYRAKALGLTMKTALANLAAVSEYTMYTLPASFRPDTSLFKGVDTEKIDTPAWVAAKQDLDAEVEEKAQALFALEDWSAIPKVEKEGMKKALANASKGAVAFEEKRLSFVNGVMTPLVGPATPIPPDWDEELAAELLRQLPSYMFDVRGTDLVLERLYELVEEAQKAKDNIRAFAHFLTAGLFHYDETYFQWTYLEYGMERPLWEIDYTQAEFLEKAKYYFLFKEFSKKADAVRAALGQDYVDLATDADRGAAIRKINELKSKAAELSAVLDKAIKPDRAQPDQSLILTTVAFRNEAAQYGYDAEEIVNFYRELINVLRMVPQGSFKG